MQLSSETIQNLSYFWNKKTQIFFSFIILSNFGFVLVDILVYINIDQDINCYKSNVAQNEKKNIWVFLSRQIVKHFALDNFIKHKPLISEK